ncbi:hypothetical protein SAMN06893097_105145 [Geodermatophilus sabuli]|uniref:Uncharacterized protein n=1 Tax=Geodermatophilus sabuli TaxID=1564158 RepID=A0A285EFG5_9ACTN|nr:hypothetical protein SAMN06893097_105145 [Geodermatophilus sabuli]
MTSGGVVVLFVLLGITALSVTTLGIAVRGGRGPADPPASHARVDPGGFPVLSEPRGLLPRHPPQPRHPRGPRRSRPLAARAAAAIQTARERRTARPTSPGAGARPLPSTDRSSTRLP